MASQPKIRISSEVVHNWIQVYSKREPYTTLPAAVKDALRNACIAHHGVGISARDLALDLAAHFPDTLQASVW